MSWRLQAAEETQFDESEDTIVIVQSFGSGVLLADVARGRERVTLRSHDAGVRSANLSRDGSRPATYASDGSVRVWQLSLRGEVGGVD